MSEHGNNQGLLISFDGTDSSGKATQARLLAERLKSKGVTVSQFFSPDYDTPSGQKLKSLFQGIDRSWSELSFDEQNDLFAENRAEHRDEVQGLLSQGGIAIYDRYVPSSLAHRVVDALEPKDVDQERIKIREIVANREYEGNEMPHEDISIFLDVPPKVAHGLLEGRKTENKDANEMTDSIALQQRIYNEYQWMCANHGDKYIRIECMQGSKLLAPEQIAKQVWHLLQEKFPQLAKNDSSNDG